MAQSRTLKPMSTKRPRVDYFAFSKMRHDDLETCCFARTVLPCCTQRTLCSSLNGLSKVWQKLHATQKIKRDGGGGSLSAAHRWWQLGGGATAASALGAVMAGCYESTSTWCSSRRNISTLVLTYGTYLPIPRHIIVTRLQPIPVGSQIPYDTKYSGISMLLLRNSLELVVHLDCSCLKRLKITF